MEFMWVYDGEREGKELKEENKGRKKKKEKSEHRKKKQKKRENGRGRKCSHVLNGGAH